MVLLIDERPEEVTDMRRTVKGEVIVRHVRSAERRAHPRAELAIEKAKRLVEQGDDVVIILDGITASAVPTTSPRPPRSHPVWWNRPGLVPAEEVLVPPATSRRRLRSPSWPLRWSRPTVAWTTRSSRSSRAPATWSFRPQG